MLNNFQIEFETEIKMNTIKEEFHVLNELICKKEPK